MNPADTHEIGDIVINVGTRGDLVQYAVFVPDKLSHFDMIRAGTFLAGLTSGSAVSGGCQIVLKARS